MKLGTVRSRINRARTRFRALIKPMLRNESLLAELEQIEERAAQEKLENKSQSKSNRRDDDNDEQDQ